MPATLTGNGFGPEADTGGEPDGSAGSAAVPDDDLGVGAPVAAPSMPAVLTGEETGAGAQAG